MSSKGTPTTMKAWQYSSAKGGIENNMKINDSAPVPKPNQKQHLVQVVALALNPVDFKMAEAPLIGGFLHPKPAIPGLDFAGRMVKPAPGSSLKEGDLVFGGCMASLAAGGGLADYAVAATDTVAKMPENVSFADASTINVAGVTAYQSIVPHIKSGSRVFLNGGSGGTGMYGIQIAKAKGCYVACSCSTANVELCKSLGADEVLDYKKEPLITQLKRQKPFDLVVDNVGHDFDLYWKSHEYTNPKAPFVEIAAAPSFTFFSFMIKVKLLPGFLGGGKRKFVSLFAEPKTEILQEIAQLVAEGKVKAKIDEQFPWEKAPDAFRKLKTGRAKGKIVVDVGPQEK